MAYKNPSDLKQYYQKNRSRIIARSALRYKNNKESILKNRKSYYLKNRTLHELPTEKQKEYWQSLNGKVPWNKGKKGLQVAWNKGLTKETSPSIAKGGKRNSLTRTGKWYGYRNRKAPASNKGKSNLKIRGKNHFNWKGGTSKGYRKGYRDNLVYKKWRKKVFERDDYTCQSCRITGVYITAHHVKSFAKYPELRLEVSNGITLCEECHKLTDNYKGRGNKK